MEALKTRHTPIQCTFQLHYNFICPTTESNYLITRQLIQICDDLAIIRKSEIMSMYLQAQH